MNLRVIKRMGMVGLGNQDIDQQGENVTDKY